MRAYSGAAASGLFRINGNDGQARQNIGRCAAETTTSNDGFDTSTTRARFLS